MPSDGIQLQIHGRTLKTSLRELVVTLLSGLGKTFAAAKTQGASLTFTPNILSDFSGVLKAFKFEETLELRAWLLVSGGLMFAIEKAVSIVAFQNTPGEDAFRDLANDIATRVETRSYTIEPDFFSSPNRLPLLDDVAHELSSWISRFGVNWSPKTAKANLEMHFAAGLHRTWMKNPKFVELETALSSPFTSTLKIAQEREAYLQYVEEEFTRILLIGQEQDNSNAVRLAQVFVPLRAFYEEQALVKQARHARRTNQTRPHDSEDDRLRRHVVPLFHELDTWSTNPERGDVLRIVSGGPGIGKSSSMRAYGARIARDGQLYPILIPLQKLPHMDQPLRTRIAAYLTNTKGIPFTQSPLDLDALPIPILLIFDGLDELVRPGKDADEIAREFMYELRHLLESQNGNIRPNQTPSMIAIVAGRVAVAGSAARALKQSGKQILHLLRFVENEKDKTFFDPRRLLREDQRKTWWSLWRAATQNVPRRIPKALLASSLFEVTVEPLLLYFVAFIRPWELASAKESLDRNWLYNKLLEDFYHRECSKGDRNFATEFQSFAEYETVLQAMAFAAWYDGSTRTATIDTVLALLANWNEDLANSLTTIIGSHKPAIGAALAFYMKPGEQPNSLEFMHKTFAEYLVSRRMVAAVRSIADTFSHAKSQQSLIRKSSVDENQLLEWLRLLGPRPIDHDILRFLRDEIATIYAAEKECVQIWQSGLVRCVNEALHIGIPAHKLFMMSERDIILKPRNFREAAEHARNAEESLFAALNATILPRLNDSKFVPIKLNPPNHEYFRSLIHRLNASSDVNPIEMMLFDGLDLATLSLPFENLLGLSAQRANLEEIELFGCHVGNADFRWANLRNSLLSYLDSFEADFSNANFAGARIKNANLEYTDFVSCNMENVDFGYSRFLQCDMTGASLLNAKMNHCRLEKCNLTRANLAGANLTGSNLSGVNLTSANLEGADLEDANLTEAILTGVTGIDVAKVRNKRVQS